MLICEHASVNINLHYSALKRIELKGFSWEGSTMPLKIGALGELAHLEVSLVDDQGHRQPQAFWGSNVLCARFEANRRYDLTLRLEYSPPYRLDTFTPDFENVDPQTYSLSLDFNPHTMFIQQPQIDLGFGAWRESLDARKPVDFRGPTGLEITLNTHPDRCYVSVAGKRRIPLVNRLFPTLAIKPGDGSTEDVTDLWTHGSRRA